MNPKTIDEILKSAEGDHPWHAPRQAALDEARARITPLADRAKASLSVVRQAQQAGAKVLQWFSSHRWDLIGLTPACNNEVTDLSKLCVEEHDAVREALAELDALSIRDVIDELERWAVDPNKLGYTVSSIEVRLRTVIGKELRIYQLIDTVKSACEDVAASCQARGGVAA